MWDIKKFIIISYLLVTGVVFANPQEAEVSSDKLACELLVARAGEDLKKGSGLTTRKMMSNFGFRVHQQLVRDIKDGKSLTTSPFSITSMLGMALNGAGGLTLQQMSEAFSRGMDLPEVEEAVLETMNLGYPQITSSLTSVGEGNVLTFGNMVISDLEFPLLANFVKTVGSAFDAVAETMDFSDEEAVLERINGYIEEKTNGMIKDLLKTAPTAAALINAGRFKGGWATLFDIEETVEEWEFALADGTRKKVPMMFHHKLTFPYYEDDDIQMVTLAYQHADFAMDLIVPKTFLVNQSALLDVEGVEITPLDAIKRLMKNLTAENYESWLKESAPKKLDVLGLPRWKTETMLSDEIKKVLEGEMASLFDPGLADLTRLSEVPSYMSDVVHATVVETNELGSTGAFVTVGSIGVTSIMRGTEVIADHPFVAVIRHVPTGTPVFIITEMNPEPMDRPTEKEIAEAKGE